MRNLSTAGGLRDMVAFRFSALTKTLAGERGKDPP